MWLVRAGMSASVWFTPDTRQYIGTMARVLLQLGNRKNRLVAKRIGQYLLLRSDTSRARHTVEFRVVELLGDIGELLLPDEREKNWTSRMRTAVEEGLELLTRHEVVKCVEWPDGFGPGDIDRYKGWSDRWLNARIRITVGDRWRKSGQTRDSSSKAKRRDQDDPLRMLGAEIRNARMNIIPQYTQEQLGACPRNNDFAGSV
jgi:hypothetical protein